MSGTQEITAFIAMLAALDADTTESEGSDAARIDELTALELAKSAICARQARVTDRFAVSQRAKLVAAGSTPGDATRSVGSQVALARRDSPTMGNRHIGLAATLVHELPGVLRALERGDTSEWRVTLIARETAHLSREHRARIDAEIADDLHGWGDARTEREARAWAQRLDPDGAAGRARKAATDRRVSIRPAPDCMAYLTAFLPMVEGVTTYGVLHRAALTANCDPDDHRTKGQVMADELVKPIATPGEGEPERPALEVHLVMTDRALADADPEPAQLVGYGPVPAAVARNLVRADEKTDVFVRRLYTDPTTGDLAATDARRRDFPHVARIFLTCRDQICRTHWCGAPIRHADHAVAVSKGGQTNLHNGSGRCARCNLTKDLDGWPPTSWPVSSPPRPRPVTVTPAAHPHPRHPHPGRRNRTQGPRIRQSRPQSRRSGRRSSHPGRRGGRSSAKRRTGSRSTCPAPAIHAGRWPGDEVRNGGWRRATARAAGRRGA